MAWVAAGIAEPQLVGPPAAPAAAVVDAKEAGHASAPDACGAPRAPSWSAPSRPRHLDL